MTFEIALKANETSYNIGDKNVLKTPNKVFGVATRAYHADRQTQSGKALISDSLLKKANLVLKDANRSEVVNLPLESVVEDVTGYKAFLKFPPMVIDPAESLVVFASGTSISAGSAIELTFYVEELTC